MAGGAVVRYNRRHRRRLVRKIVRRATARVARSAARSLKRRASTQLQGYFKRRIIDPVQQRLYSQSRPAPRRYTRIVGNAAGTTHTTTRMIVRKTPSEQKFLRKMFKEHSQHVKHVQRFGFSFLGAQHNNKAIWYSVTHLKYNNIINYMQHRITAPTQNLGAFVPNLTNAAQAATKPTNFIYLGKCTFNYEIYNPTNYNMTVYIYDLVCKRDTPKPIKYGSDQAHLTSNSPEACMHDSSESIQIPQDNIVVGDPIADVNSSSDPNDAPDWRSVGMKPTDYFYFNTMWKIKGMKKLVLPPQTSHHHVVIFNPKKKITLGSLVYPHTVWNTSSQNGLGGLTQSTLFGIEGQVATDKSASGSTGIDSDKVGTLPGKLLIKCIRKVNCYNFELNAATIINKNELKNLTDPLIFSDLFQVTPENP